MAVICGFHSGQQTIVQAVCQPIDEDYLDVSCFQINGGFWFKLLTWILSAFTNYIVGNELKNCVGFDI